MTDRTKGKMSDPVRDKVAEQAFEWILQLDAPARDPSTELAFAAWLKESPVHVEEFLTLEAIWRELDRIDPERTVRVSELVANPDGNVVPLDVAATPHSTDPLPSRSRRRWFLGAAAAVIAIATIRGPLMPEKDTYVTGLGEQSSFTLDDGSVVHLNTQSRLRIRLTDSVRNIELLSGEALFQVAKDPARPFRVTAANTIVEALGTRFNVYYDSDETTVTVVEGKVAVSRRDAVPATRSDAAGELAELPSDPVTLVAGEQVAVNLAGAIQRRGIPDTEEVTAWRERRLVFKEDTLAAIAEQFNRYNRLRIEVSGEAARRQLTGVFDADDPESMVEFLDDVSSIQVTYASDRIVITDR